jgi:nucleotide-binding universal stress UspA family protein
MVPRAGPIVIGVDGSRASLRAADMAWRIAERSGRPCYPVYAVPEAPTALLVPDLFRGARAAFRLSDSTARARVERALRGVVPRAVAEQLEARPGRAPIVLAEAARRRAATLVVLGAASESPGQTAQYLVRRGTTSILVVRSGRAIRRILVAIDGSAASRPALAAAQDVARLWDAQVRAVHVVEVVQFPVALPPGAHNAELLRRSQHALDRLLSRYAGITGSVRRAPSASAGIAAEAAKQRADLVVVSSQRRGRIERLLLGRTTERLLVDLPTSLLVVRPPRR